MADDTFDRVIWGDAHAMGGQYAVTDIKHEPLIVRTYGVIIRDDEDGIAIAAEDIPEEDPMNYRGITFIPRSLVIGVERFRKVKPRKSRAPKPVELTVEEGSIAP